MNLTGVTAVSNAGQAGSASSELSSNFDTFLVMLTTQLQNQDPLDPTDSNEFTNQLVQFSQVEQQISTNKNLENLIDVDASNILTSALTYIGLDVETIGNKFALQEGQGDFTYVLPEEAESVSILILDDKGNTIRKIDGEGKTAGRHAYSWDGLNENGTEAGDGVYQVAVNYEVEGQTTQSATTLVSGRVTGMEMYQGEPILLLGDVPVQMTQIVSALSPDAPRKGNDDVTDGGDGDTDSGDTGDTDTETSPEEV